MPASTVQALRKHYVAHLCRALRERFVPMAPRQFNTIALALCYGK